MPAYDFTPLDAPMDGVETAARRRVMLAGRSLLRELGGSRLALFVVMIVVVWPTVLVASGSMLRTVVTWVAWNGPTPEWGWGAPLLFGAVLVAIGSCVFLTRLALIPPAWRRWTRMHRFAEANGMTFLRRVTERGAAPGLGDFGTAPLTEVFIDPVARIVLGNAGAGFGRQAFVLLQSGEPAGERTLDGDAQPLDGFVRRATRDGTLALRHRGVRLRDSTALRRMFATALALRGDAQPSRPSPGRDTRSQR